MVMPRKAPITLKREIAALLASGNFGSLALVLDDKDVLLLLRAAIEREGSIGGAFGMSALGAVCSDQHMTFRNGRYIILRRP